ncbi:MAG: enoyl-CoA hydratase/isomerase family protein [Clostridia bacterium]|nr:enoyl-CoA hydratase/isomerase family protein [Clostridia bacterium]
MPDILFEKSDGVGLITLNRPEQRNAFSQELLDGWVAALQECVRDDDVRVVVVTGAGEAFCAGGDVKEMERGYGLWEGKNVIWKQIHRIPLTLRDLDKPYIAAVNGAAFGAGLDMALMADLRIASERATFCEAYVRVGLAPGDGGAYFLPRVVGLPKALELLLTADVIDAQEALRIGLVNRVVPHDQLMEATMQLARRLAQGPALAQQIIKRAVHQAVHSDLRSHLDYISSQMALLFQSEDHREGVRAFLEKRRPNFKGR